MAVNVDLAGSQDARPVTVLVLTPCIGGHFFGELVAGLSREVARAAGRIVLVQTLDGGVRIDEESELSAFAVPVAWDEVDGVVSITTAVQASYLQRLRDAGLPVVLASTRMEEFDAPVALPNNHDGTFAVVQHLIDHGHSRIGFVGNLAQPDIRDRFAAYREAIEENGITADPALVFATGNNDFTGGAAAADQVLAAPTRPTAVMVATDRNAIGLMDALRAAGVSVPGDIAIVGFDNMEEAAFSTPPLTSVNQRFDEIGALAGRLVLKQIRGQQVSFGLHAPSSFSLQLRGSCGCTPDGVGTAIIGRADRALSGPVERPAHSSRDELAAALREGLLVDDASHDPLDAAIEETVAGVERLRYGGGEITAADIEWLAGSLNRLAARPNVLRRITLLVMAYLHAAPPARDGASAMADVWQVTTALWQLQAGAFLAQAETARAALQEQYAVDARMLTADRADLCRLDWLADTHVAAGALALWEQTGSGRQLRVVGSYDPDGRVPALIDTVTTAEQFPPEELIAAAGSADGRVCIVVPICTNDREWGLLAVLGKPDATSALQTYRHWAIQLCASFEAEELQDSVRQSEQRYAFAARAGNDGLWELKLRSGDFYLSDRCMEMLGIEPRADEDRRALWLARVHPEDVSLVRALTESVSSGTKETGSCEYRVRVSDGSYRWVLARALAVRSSAGVVDRVVGSLSDVHERHCLEDQLRENALFDALTGLPNRRLFLSRLEQAVALWERTQLAFAVIFLDLDGFKAINDSLGHQMGDRVLKEVGARIKRELRGVDTGARFGGDEFAILVADAEHDGALGVARRVQSALAEVIRLDDHRFAIGASFGVATSEVGYTCAEDVLRDADTAMYQAKQNDRGTISFFDSAMHAQAMQELRLGGEIRQALDEHQFEMRYQPIVNLVTGRTDRFEALVRWRHPERGLLMPDDFLPAMEESGAIVQLGHWIIDEVCRQLAAWGPEVANVALNVSDREFWHGDLQAQVVAGLARHQLGADRLTLEITEGVIMRRPEVAVRMMRELHDAGLRLHIDDFGTGYSSLETLHRFPVDAFKIDRSFIADLTTSDRIEELVRAIVAMGSALNLDVVAEGVETSEQLEFLQRIGCSAGQGFLFMPAVSGDHALATLGRVLGPLGSRRPNRPTADRSERRAVVGGRLASGQ